MTLSTGVRTAALAAISHGTNDPAGQAAVRALIEHTAAKARSDGSSIEIRLGHVDVQQPDTAATLAECTAEEPAVIVPLLLSAGYHVNVDLREAADAATRPVTVTGALGPDVRLADALEQRLQEVGADPTEDVVVLGAAGSSSPGAVRDVQSTAQLLSARLGCPVQDSYLSFAQPTVADAVSAARQADPGKRIVVASYLLAPGYFQRLMTRQGADLVTGPLLNSADGAADVPSGLPQIVLERFQEGLATL